MASGAPPARRADESETSQPNYLCDGAKQSLAGSVVGFVTVQPWSRNTLQRSCWPPPAGRRLGMIEITKCPTTNQALTALPKRCKKYSNARPHPCPPVNSAGAIAAAAARQIGCGVSRWGCWYPGPLQRPFSSARNGSRPAAPLPSQRVSPGGANPFAHDVSNISPARNFDVM